MSTKLLESLRKRLPRWRRGSSIRDGDLSKLINEVEWPLQQLMVAYRSDSQSGDHRISRRLPPRGEMAINFLLWIFCIEAFNLSSIELNSQDFNWKHVFKFRVCSFGGFTLPNVPNLNEPPLSYCPSYFTGWVGMLCKTLNSIRVTKDNHLNLLINTVA